MEKHLLVTVGDDASRSFSLRFIDNFFSNMCELKLTLFYVAPRSTRYSQSVAGAKKLVYEGAEDIKGRFGDAAVVKARDWVVGKGCELGKVKPKVVHSRHGTAKEIIGEAHDGLYDAVVLGRRGLSWLEELLGNESVTDKILWEDMDFPVWLCPRPDETGLKNVLLLADGSPEALRMADNVGFMLSDEPAHDITVLYVKGERDQADPNTVFEATMAALAENGVDEDRVRRVVVHSGDPAKEALDEAKRGRYAVVAAGRRSSKNGAAGRHTPGSVSQKLLKNMENFSLWISK